MGSEWRWIRWWPNTYWCLSLCYSYLACIPNREQRVSKCSSFAEMGYRFLVHFTVQVSCSKFSYRPANQVYICLFLRLEPHLTICPYPTEVISSFFLHVMRKHFAGECLFSKYPVCPKCDKIYDSFDNCVEKIGTRKLSKYCNHIQFPKYPHQSRRTECRALLLKTVQFRSGWKVLYPFNCTVTMVLNQPCRNFWCVQTSFKLSAVEIKSCE